MVGDVLVAPLGFSTLAFGDVRRGPGGGIVLRVGDLDMAVQLDELTDYDDPLIHEMRGWFVGIGARDDWGPGCNIFEMEADEHGDRYPACTT